MALLISRESLGRPKDGLARDLSEEMDRVLADFPLLDDSVFDLRRVRAWTEEYCRRVSPPEKSRPVQVETRTFVTPAGLVGSRVYNPRETNTVVLLHGGGWVACSLDTHDHIARWLASELRSRVVMVDYSLAPEHPFPRAIEECTAVVSELLDETAQGRVIVVGDSAGANLGAMSILRLPAAQRRRLAGFISIYGAYAPEMDLSSHKLYGDGRYGLSETEMRRFWSLYAPTVDPAERRRLLSPVGSEIGDFPATLCIGAECDVLLDDTLIFYAELTRASVDVTLSLWPDLPHGCLHYVDRVGSVTRAAESIVRFASEQLGRVGGLRHPRIRHDAGHGGGESPAALPVGRALEPSLPRRSKHALARKIAIGIVRGEKRPGDVLPNEDRASASLGISRTAYREAIRTLVAKGLVSALPKVGTKVAPRARWHLLDPDVLEWHFEVGASPRLINDLFELRKIVEPSAAALTAARRSDGELSALADSLARMARLQLGTPGWLETVTDFHRQLMIAGGNEVIAALWPAIETTLVWSMRQQTAAEPLFLHDPVADHARVFQKIASRDEQGALEEMALLIDAALEDTLANIDRSSTLRTEDAADAEAL